MSTGVKKRRIVELDLLRGFFICVIILDHLQFWPSSFQYLTGQGRLWVSAAEGFFLISGLLIGYLRAYKGAKTPLTELSKHLLARAGMLYLWGVAVTFVVVAIAALLPGDGALLPRLPEVNQVASLPVYFWNIISTTFQSDWIYFLRLYAIMLALTPVFLWFIRKGLWWVAALISLTIYTASLTLNINEAAMQWQILFFGAALIGWKFETILHWLNRHLVLRRIAIATFATFMLSTFALSYFMVHGWSYVESPATSITREAYVSVRASVDPLFSNNPLVPMRILLAYVWFIGLLAIFHVLRPWLMKYLGWLLMTFGQSSLTGYILQALILPFIVVFVDLGGNFWLNGLFSTLLLVGFNLLMRLRWVQRVIPR